MSIENEFLKLKNNVDIDSFVSEVNDPYVAYMLKSLLKGEETLDRKQWIIHTNIKKIRDYRDENL